MHDIVVVGGGVIGLTCAWRLAQAGAKVALLERGYCGCGASGASLGVLMPPTATVNTPLQQLQRESLWSFEEFSCELRQASGIDICYRRCGLLEILHGPYRRSQAELVVPAANASWPALGNEPVMSLLSNDEARALEPQAVFGELGARLCRSTAQVCVSKLLEALQLACLQSGVSIEENCNVSGLLFAHDRLKAVCCDNETVQAGKFVIATGAWISQLDPLLQKYAPIAPVRGQALLLRTADSVASHIIKRKKIYIAPRDERHILVGSTTERGVGYNSKPSAQGIASLAAGAIELIPTLSEGIVERVWAGLRPESLVKVMLMGAIPRFSNLFIAAGHFKTGIGFAPITGRIMADLMTRGAASYDVSEFDPRRVTAES